MRLASFSTSDLPRARLGIVQGDEIVDVDLAARALNRTPYESMLDLIDHYDQGLPDLQAILQKAAGRRFSDVRTFADIGAVHALSKVQLAAPIPRPCKNIVCLGLNYADHAKESAEARGRQAAILEDPLFFTKAPTDRLGSRTGRHYRQNWQEHSRRGRLIARLRLYCPQRRLRARPSITSQAIL